MNLKQDNTLAMKIQRQTYILITQIFNRVPALIFEGNIGKELTNVTKMFTFKYFFKKKSTILSKFSQLLLPLINSLYLAPAFKLGLLSSTDVAVAFP